MWILWFFVISLFSVALGAELKVVERDDQIQLRIYEGDELRLTSPPEGLWSIAESMEDGWPSSWVHASPEEVKQSGPWTILKGSLEVSGGKWILRDAYRQEGVRIKCIRRWGWLGKEPAEPITLSVRWLSAGNKCREVLPGILYHGNPSGAATGRVPVFGRKQGEVAYFEEHRYPSPFASLEWDDGDHVATAALHSLPSTLPYAARPDLWWSLGLTQHASKTEISLLSGPCALNGKRGFVKAGQAVTLPYPNAFLRVPSGAVIEKTFYLQTGSVEKEGDGFRIALKSSIEGQLADSLEGFPEIGEILEAKWRFAKSRWFENSGYAGFCMYPNRETLVMGWCGQAASPGYALQVLGPRLAADSWQTMCQKSLDTLAQAEFYQTGFRVKLEPKSGKWSQGDPLSEGQGLFNFTRAIRLGRLNGLQTDKWENFVVRACQLHAERILNPEWSPKSTNEAFLVAPLADAAALFDRIEFRRAALKAANHYLKRHRDMREPYWGGTLDASCEDKEGSFAALQAFIAAYRLTGEDRYLDGAKHAADVTLSYLMTWDIELPAGRLRDHGFRTRGWTAVSVQNMHIDAYGVLIAPELYRLGALIKDTSLQKTAILMFRSCGQIIDPLGSHGEQPQHTNFSQDGRVTQVEGIRGGYNETWTVFWLTAHFLNAAADFAEQGLKF